MHSWQQLMRSSWGWSLSLFTRSLSLTPEFKHRFYFPLKRLDQLLDGTYPKQTTWLSKWKAYLQQFHKLRIDQIKDMLCVCARRKVIPLDLWHHLRTDYWTSKLSEAKGRDLASLLHALSVLNTSRQLGIGCIKQEAFTEGVFKQAMQRKDLMEFSDIALSQCLQAFALFDLKSHPLVPMYSSEVVRPERRKTRSFRIMANVFWSWAKLGYANRSHIKLLSESAVAKRTQSNDQELVNLIWAWGTLQYASMSHWQAVLREISRRSSSSTEHRLLTVFISSAKVGVVDDVHEGLLSALMQSNKAALFTSQALMDLVWSVGRLKLPKDHPCVRSLLNTALMASRLKAARTRDLCRLATGMVYLNHPDNEHRRRLQQEILQSDRLKSIHSHELCCLIWAFGKMAVHSEEVQMTLGKALTARTDMCHLESVNCSGLSSVMTGWAHCGFFDKDVCGVVFREVMKSSRLKAYSSQELSNLCWSFAKLGVRSPSLHHRLAETVLARDPIGFASHGYVQILIGWAHARYINPSAVESIAGRLKPQSLTSQELANVCWAMGRLDFSRADLALPFHSDVIRPERLRSFTSLQLSMILLGWSKSAMHDWRLWDRIVQEFTRRNEPHVDMPTLNNFAVAIRAAGFNGLDNYRKRRHLSIDVT